MKNFGKIIYRLLIACGIFSLYLNSIFAYSSGPINGVTGAPGESTCDQTSCHNSFSLNSGSAKFQISVAKNYSLGETLDITVSFSDSTTSTHGFEITAQDANDNYIGTFTSVDSNTQIDSNWAKHTLAGDKQTEWNLKWTAPSSEVQNPVTFYSAGNEANGNGLPTGDYIYTTTAVVSQVTATPTATATSTLTPVQTPTLSATPTPVCGAVSITVAPKRLRLTRRERGGMIVIVRGADNCSVKGETVTTKILRGSKNLISISPKRAVTDANGAATFTITAKGETGNARIRLEVGGLKKTVTIKVRK